MRALGRQLDCSSAEEQGDGAHERRPSGEQKREERGTGTARRHSGGAGGAGHGVALLDSRICSGQKLAKMGR